MLKDQYEDALCGLCGSDNAEKCYKLRVSNIVECERCGLNYTSPRVSSERINTQLQDWATKDVVDAERLRIAFDSRTLRLYSQYLKLTKRNIKSDSKRLLDIGCSTGALLTIARDMGFDVEGLELGRASAKYAREQLNLKIIEGSIYSVDYPAESFDVVTITEVIEHLEEPLEALTRIYKWLKPGGVVLLTTPNYDALYRRLYGSSWWVINCEEEHIIFFKPVTLRLIFNQIGFEVLKEMNRGFDVSGMFWAHMRKKSGGSKKVSSESLRKNERRSSGYYEARTNKERIKMALNKIGLLAIARFILMILGHTFSLKWSPTYAWGEQLVFFARKPVQ